MVLEGRKEGSSIIFYGFGLTTPERAKGSFTLLGETMGYQTHDNLITFSNGLGSLKTKSGGRFRGVEVGMGLAGILS